ncbi:MAG: RNA polymerase sigma-70 factor [Balneolaceae bacterium]|nr:RNA polymerase sigma-70 factor [Balneolaceae bacterium]
MKFLMFYLLILLALRKENNKDNPELLLAIKSGDHKAFKLFFDVHHSYLYHFLLKKGLSEQQAEDLVQQAFVMIWEKREEIDEQKSLRAYLFRIAYTRMLNLFRDHSKFDENAETEATESDQKADANIENQELAEALTNAINQMPEKRQEVFRLCFIQEFTYKSAAEVLGVSVKTIENHMGLALKDLRNKLDGFR